MRNIDRTQLKPTIVSVITVCFNRESDIRYTIESVLKQTYPFVEYLIIDGASTDSTLSVARQYEKLFAKKGYRYRVVSEPDSGIYDAMNKGIRMATGELIAFLNAGDWYEKTAISFAVEEYSKMRFDYFYADVRLIRPKGKPLIKHSRKDFFPSSRHWNHPTNFTLRSVYEELGLFRCQGIHDDFEFFLRVRKAGKKIVIRNKVLANFKTGGTSNRKDLKTTLRRIRDRYQGYRRNGYNRLYILECIGIEVVKYFWL